MDAQQIFQICEHAVKTMGNGFEFLETNYHIINISGDDEPVELFRVYHSGGYCFEVQKELVEHEGGEPTPEYTFFDDKFEGFDPCSEITAYDLLLRNWTRAEVQKLTSLNA